MALATSRRVFLAASSFGLAALAIDAKPAQPNSQSLASGPAYARIGKRGLDPGAPGRPSVGQAALLDGRMVDIRNEAALRIMPGKSVWLSPAADGVLSVLYAEV